MSLAPQRELSPIELVILQGTPFCNLNCSYCDLSSESRRRKAVMSMELLEHFFTDVFNSGLVSTDVAVAWHLGEPLTLPQSYYGEAFERILAVKDASKARATALKFKIQTNGVLLDKAWCTFFERYRDVLDIGVSCDGPAALHDAFRVNWAGRSTHAQTARGMDLLQAHGLRYKVIAVVTRRSLAEPDAFYEFFAARRDWLSGFHFNLLAAGDSANPELSFTTADRDLYYAFYRRLLQRTRDADSEGRGLKIENFVQTLSRLLSDNPPGSTSYVEDASAPLRSLTLDTEGNVATFYAGLGIEVLPDLYGDGLGLALGNIGKMSISDMARSRKLHRVMADFASSTASCRSACDYFPVCSGGYEVTKQLTKGTFAVAETTECLIHMKTLIDAVLDDVGDFMDQGP